MAQLSICINAHMQTCSSRTLEIMDARKSHLLISFSLLLINSLFNHTLCLELCNPHDKDVLLQIRNQFGNPASLESWNPETDCCKDWSGYLQGDVTVNCDGQGHVIDLWIDGADDISSVIPPVLGTLASLQTLKLYNMPKLFGPINTAICNLTNLWSLTLAYGNLSGTIPKCLGQLKNLKNIEISGTSITGHIPQELVQLPNLQEVNLNFNKLYGLIPEFPTQSNGVYHVSLVSNNLSGPIPASFGLLSNISLLSLSRNRLTGPILPSLGYVSRPNLLWLDLSWNRLNGSIPESFSSLTDSIYLQLQGNRLTGPIPKSLGRLSATWLDLSSNRLTGDATFLFSGDKYWTDKINLDNNRLKFNLSNVVEIPQELSTVNISHNKIYGSLPGQLCRLWSLDVSYNQLCGPIPSGCERFGPSSFANNKCLCGPPLPACNS